MQWKGQDCAEVDGSGAVVDEWVGNGVHPPCFNYHISEEIRLLETE